MRAWWNSYFYIADLLSHDPFALLANEDGEFKNRAVVNARNALDGCNTGTFDE